MNHQFVEPPALNPLASPRLAQLVSTFSDVPLADDMYAVARYTVLLPRFGNTKIKQASGYKKFYELYKKHQNPDIAAFCRILEHLPSERGEKFMEELFPLFTHYLK